MEDKPLLTGPIVLVDQKKAVNTQCAQDACMIAEDGTDICCRDSSWEFDSSLIRPEPAIDFDDCAAPARKEHSDRSPT